MFKEKLMPKEDSHDSSGLEQESQKISPEDISKLVNESVKRTLNEENTKKIAELANEFLKFRDKEEVENKLSANFNTQNGKKLETADDLIMFFETEIERVSSQSN